MDRTRRGYQLAARQESKAPKKFKPLASKPKRAPRQPVGALKRPAIHPSGIRIRRPNEMKLLPKLLLGGGLVLWAIYEALMPPFIIKYWTLDWGGMWHTRHTRGVDMGFLEHSTVNGSLIVLECSLVIVAVGLGLHNSRRNSNDDLAINIASRAFAASAAVLHAGVILLPLINAGSDTIWLGRNPIALAFGIVVLWPNVIAFAIAVRLIQDKTGKLSKKSVVIFLVFIACLWSVILVVGVVGHLDVKIPLSGFILGTVALWLTVLARALRRDENLDPSDAALRSIHNP